MRYWAVNSKYFDSGRTKAKIYLIEAEKKPENIMKENKMCDEYEEYFESYEEALKFYKDTQKA